MLCLDVSCSVFKRNKYFLNIIIDAFTKWFLALVLKCNDIMDINKIKRYFIPGSLIIIYKIQTIDT